MNLPHSITPEHPDGALCVPGGVFKHYEIRSCLSQGSLGQVFEGWDTILCRKVLIKQIALGASGVNMESFGGKVRKIAALKHAAFARIHAIEEGRSHLFIITEYISGMPLLTWVRANSDCQKSALVHILRVAEAMREAHALNLFHGNLKPTNLMVDGSGKVRILDWGLTSHGDASAPGTQGAAHADTAYCAPELHGSGSPGAASDVYAIGVILYELMAGRLPIAARNGLFLVGSQLPSGSGQWHWPASIAPAARQLILAMTALQASQRLASAQVVEECMQFVEPQSGSLTSFDLTQLQARLASDAAQRRRRKSVLRAVLFVLAVSALLFGAWQVRPYWPQIAKVIRPYSESLEMELGIEDMTQYAYIPSSARLDSATAHFATVLEHTPNHAGAVGYMSLVYLSRYHAEKRDEIWLQKAKASAQQAIKLDSQLAISQIANARILYWHHKFPEAMDALNRALILEPKNLFAYHTKMSILLESHLHDEAIRLADVGAMLFPQDRFLLELKGGIYLDQSNFTEAEKILRMSLQRQPDSSNGYALLAQSLAGQKRSAEALQVIQQGLQIRPNALLYSALGEAKFDRGDYAAAAAAFAIAASPDKGVTGSYYHWSKLAEALMWVPGRRSEGLAAYEKARALLEIRLNRSPDDGRLLLDMSMILARQGNFAQAKLLAEQGLKTGSKAVDKYFQAGLTFELIGQRGLALEAINNARQLGYSAERVENQPILNALRMDPGYKQVITNR
jgi:serine/threonine-protein kinase